MKCHNLVQFFLKISLFFRKTKFTILKFIYFHFETLNKQMMVFFHKRLGKTLIWQKFSGT